MADSRPPVALITGAARRIGACIARSLHAAGYDLVLHCRNSRAELDALCIELETARAGSTLAVQADLAQFDHLPELIAHTIGHYGRLDALVNNASTFYPTPLGGITPAQWDEMFAANARAPFFLSQAAAPHLRATRGAIVNITDIYADRPLPRHAVYCMSKAALAMATKALAQELGPEVRVNSVAPGNVLWSENPIKAETMETILARTSLRRQGTPADIANAVLWLLRDAVYVTGETIRVDGGRTLSI